MDKQAAVAFLCSLGGLIAGFMWAKWIDWCDMKRLDAQKERERIDKMKLDIESLRSNDWAIFQTLGRQRERIDKLEGAKKK